MDLSRLFHKHYGNKTFVKDVEAVTSAAVEAQVIISNFFPKYIRQIQQHRRRSVALNGVIFFDSNYSKALKSVKEKLKPIHLKIDSITESTSNSTTTGDESDDDDILLFVGREEDIQVIQDKLISVDTDIFRMISVVGMTGIGKTCLARKIYKSHQVRTHFDCLAWVCPRWYSIKELLKAIAGQVMGGSSGQQRLIQEDNQQDSSLSEFEEAEIYTIKNTIFDFLAEKRYLIVIDGILTNQTWCDLGGAFPRGSTNGSRILLTTCNTAVVLAAQHNNFFCHPTEEFLNPYRLGPLNEAESWELFSKMVSLPLDYSSSLYSYKNEIVKKCDGLPLAILHLANLLSKENGDHEGFQLVLDSTIVDTDDCLGRPWTSHIVDTIVSDLPHHLKHFLFYFRYFHKYSKIPSRRLIALWIAEGLVPKPERWDQHESIAEGYLEELMKWNMIEAVKYGSNKRPKKYRLAYFLREHLLTTTASSRGTEGVVLRLADHAHNDELVMASPPEQNKLPFLSFLSFDYREGLAPGERLRSFLYSRANITKGCFRFLRVLDLERVYKPVLPMEIGRLTELRYLGLRWTYLDTLPSSILNLKKLQTLDIKHTYINTFPEPLEDMFRLRQLYLNETQFSFQSTILFLPEFLETLSGLFLSEKQTLAWYPGEYLKQLGLVCHLPSASEQERLARSISKFLRLQKLRLTSKDQLNKPFILRLKDFTRHEDLYDLYLFGRLEELLQVQEFPPNLIELTLSASNLKEDPMPTLGMLPKLTILKLYADTYIGKKMVCSSSSGFTRLEVLKIWKLKQLEEWVVEKGSMPVLRKLEIRACNSLSKLPDRFQEIATLVELKITDMPREFTAVLVEQNKDKEWYNKANVCFSDGDTTNSSIEAPSSSLPSSSTSSSSFTFGGILLLFILLDPLSASPTKHRSKVQGLPALGCVRY